MYGSNDKLDKYKSIVLKKDNDSDLLSPRSSGAKFSKPAKEEKKKKTLSQVSSKSNRLSNEKFTAISSSSKDNKI